MADETPEKPVELTELQSLSEVAEVQALYDLMSKEGLDYIELRTGKQRLALNRARPRLMPAAFPFSSSKSADSRRGGSAQKTAASQGEAIIAPLAGVFYRAASPSAAPFVKEGDTVEMGQTLCIIEAMKVMNEIKADKRGRIIKIVAENSRPVTVSQILFHIDLL